MLSHNNQAIIAAAGSRKTQHIIDCVLSEPDQQVLVTTYTNENLRQIMERLSAGTGTLPSNVTVLGWFSFLLNECVRPYQSFVLGDVGVVRGLDFIGARPRFVTKSNPRKYYLDTHSSIYRNGVADFACDANTLSGGKVIDRLARVFDHIYIDEVQDMAGYDLEFIDLLFQSPVAITVVGDPRQATYMTNTSNKNSKFRGSGIGAWLDKRTSRCVIENRVESYRCNQTICDFADGLYPDLPRTVSMNSEITEHDGIFMIKPSEVEKYVDQYSPTILRYSKATAVQGFSAINFGVSKGGTFDRVLIFPPKSMVKFLSSRQPDDVVDKAKLYVAVTRAKYSVAFVIPSRT
ncbi:MAG TPA: UvrD-helicase domain-containing protein [Actinocrinis sp.]|nr:UvrD-helicase domain-containing protein [Actinocrinis sp.]